jgi:3-oxoacyl-[acyl-carrier-protein] synthase-1
MRRVVITGMGIYSTIGKNLSEVRDSLYQGKSGIGFDPEREKMGFRSALTGILDKPELKGLLHRRLRIGLGDEGEYAFVATVEALENAGLDQDFLEKNEVGILYGNDSTAKSVVTSFDTLREKNDTTLIGSGSIFQSMNSTISMNLSVIFKLKGINFTVSAACASGSHAIGLAYFFIQNGLQDMVICGGGQEISLESMGSFDGLSAFSVRENEPTKASRPFDIHRDGLIPSGGAATLILEDYESAKKRGAPILAEVIGYGFSSNGDHISQPNVEGPARSLQRAIKNAGINARDIDYINAHATSTPIGDLMEAKALNQILGGYNIPVSSTKSMTGHEMWMGGASEAVYSTLMMLDSFIAPNINFETPDEASAKLNIISETISKKINIFLSNSFGFGGTNSTIIIKRVNL